MQFGEDLFRSLPLLGNLSGRDVPPPPPDVKNIEVFTPSVVHEAPPPPPLTDPTIAGFLWKQGRRNKYQWKKGYYAIADHSFCELASHPEVTARGAVSIIPVAVDTKSRESVRRSLPLSDIVSSEALVQTSLLAGWSVRTLDNDAVSRVFRLTTSSRVYIFRAEQPQEASAWMNGLQLVAERNAGKSEEGSDMVHIQVVDAEESREVPLSIFIKTGEREGTVLDLKERLVERRGVLPAQQILSIESSESDSGALLEPDSALLTTFLRRRSAGSGSGSGNSNSNSNSGSGSASESERLLRVRLRKRALLPAAPCAGPDPEALVREGGASQGLAVYNDIVEQPARPGDEQKKWQYKIDWSPPVTANALVIYHKRFPPTRNLVRMLTGVGESETDSWWREHLIQIHITPQPIRGEAHLTLMLEGTREQLGYTADRCADFYQRPLIYFCPKDRTKRFWLEQAMRCAFGPDGYKTAEDRDKREIWVIDRPPLVAEDTAIGNRDSRLQPTRILMTYLFRNPGSSMLIPILQCCHRFRLLLEQPGGGKEVYAKFEIQPSLVSLL